MAEEPIITMREDVGTRGSKDTSKLIVQPNKHMIGMGTTNIRTMSCAPPIETMVKCANDVIVSRKKERKKEKYINVF